MSAPRAYMEEYSAYIRLCRKRHGKEKYIMKKTALILSLSLLISIIPSVGYSEAGKTISTAEELINFKNEVNGGNTYEGLTVTLLNGIDISNRDWEAVGTEEYPFKGTFDGNGNKIAGLTFSGDDEYAGLFGYNGGTVKNLTVQTSESGINQSFVIEKDGSGNTISKQGKRLYAGVIAAYSTGNITNCTASGVVKSYNAYSYTVSGGICGMNKGTVSYCTNNARVDVTAAADWTKLYGDAYAGGICGINEGTVTSSVSSVDGVSDGNGDETKAAVYAQSTFSSAAAGGAIGDNRGIASDLTSSGTVHSKIDFGVYNMSYAYAGGICGSNNGSVADSISHCYVRSSHDNQNRSNFLMCGGIAGYNNSEVRDCTFYGMASAGNTGDYSIKSYVGGICGFNYGKLSKCEFAKEARITDTRIVSKNRWTGMYAVDYSGGICGFNEGGIITQCSAKGSVYPVSNKAENVDRSFFSGGIAGGNKGGVISLSSSETDIILDGDGDTIEQELGVAQSRKADTPVTDSDYYGGGLVGENSGRVENCYYYRYSSSANSLKVGRAGGLIGLNTGIAENCYARAAVNTDLIVSGGGIAAVNNGQVSNTYFVIDEFEEEIAGTKRKAAELQSRTAADMRKNKLFKEWSAVIWKPGGIRETNLMPAFAEEIGSPRYSGGNGTEQSPYIIKTEEDLYNIRFNKEAAYKIVNDIYYAGNWSAIGSEADPFCGSIDGNHHTLTLMSLEGAAENCGFIGYGEECDVRNLNISASVEAKGNAYTKKKYTGGIIARGREVSVENCTFSGGITVSAEYAYTGGIVGDATGTIRGCRSFGNISADNASHSAAGGIAGRLDGDISACESHMSITISDTAYDGLSETGGLCGIITGDISNSCYSGTITDNSANEKTYAGGLAGSAAGDISIAYADAKIISCGENDGGVSGKLYSGTFDNAYFNFETSPDNGIGIAAVADSFTADGLLSQFEAVGDTAYVWTADKDSGKMTLLHISPEWVTENGFTKLSLNSNSADCEIYYTTDGSNPIGSGTKYTSPFLCADLSELRYYAKVGSISTDIFNYSQVYTSKYPICFTQLPQNQKGESITTECIEETTSVTVSFISEITGDAKLYIAFYDGNDTLKFASCSDVTLVNGTNRVTFNDIDAKGASAVRLLVWDGKMVPYTQAVKL